MHVVFLRRLPRPQQFAAALVEAVERIGPVAEQHLAVGDERARLDVALDAVGLPDDGAVAHATRMPLAMAGVPMMRAPV